MATRASVPAQLLFLSLLLVACETGDGYAERVARGELARDRSYTVVVDGTAVLEIAVEYLGTEPVDPGSYHNRHDYTAIHTDFYRISLRNPGRRDIRLRGVNYRLQYGPFHGSDSVSAEGIRDSWGSDLIRAGDTLTRDNNFVYSRLPANTLFKRYRFSFADAQPHEAEFEQEVALVFLQ